jgi:hypothetical protein
METGSRINVNERHMFHIEAFVIPDILTRTVQFPKQEFGHQHAPFPLPPHILCIDWLLSKAQRQKESWANEIQSTLLKAA